MWSWWAACTGPNEQPELVPEIPPIDIDGEAVVQLIQRVRRWDVSLLLDISEGLVADHGSADCPAVDENGSWTADCTAPDGTTFSGSVARSFEGYGRRHIDAIATIAVPDGPELALDGAWAWRDGTEGDRHITRLSEFTGVARYSGKEAAGTWLAPGITGDELSVIHRLTTDDAFTILELRGGVAGLGPPYDTVRFYTIELLATSYGGDCNEPDGSIRVDWPDGPLITFDGWKTMPTLPEALACDGCGLATAFARADQEVCGDWSNFF